MAAPKRPAPKDESAAKRYKAIEPEQDSDDQDSEDEGQDPRGEPDDVEEAAEFFGVTTDQLKELAETTRDTPQTFVVKFCDLMLPLATPLVTFDNFDELQRHLCTLLAWYSHKGDFKVFYQAEPHCLAWEDRGDEEKDKVTPVLAPFLKTLQQQCQVPTNTDAVTEEVLETRPYTEAAARFQALTDKKKAKEPFSREEDIEYCLLDLGLLEATCFTDYDN